MDRLKKYVKTGMMAIGVFIGILVCTYGIPYAVKLILRRDLHIDFPWLEESISVLGIVAVFAYWWYLFEKNKKLNDLIYNLNQYLQILYELSRKEEDKKDTLRCISLSDYQMESQVRAIVERKKKSLPKENFL
jgi:hypothetical protein